MTPLVRSSAPIALLLAVLAGTTPADAEESLVIYDSQNRIVGQVVAFRGSGNPWNEHPFAPLVFIRHEGHDLLFSADGNDGFYNGVTLYFSGANCTGSAMIPPTSGLYR